MQMSKCWNCQRLQTSKTLTSPPSAVHFLCCHILFNIKIICLLCHILKDTTLHLKFTFSCNILKPKPTSSPLLSSPPPPQLWSLTLGYVEFLGVAAAGLVWGKSKKGVEAEEELGVREYFQTPGASPIVQAKQEWQQDSAEEVSPFTTLSRLRGGQSSRRRSTNHTNTHMVLPSDKATGVEGLKDYYYWCLNA